VRGLAPNGVQDRQKWHLWTEKLRTTATTATTAATATAAAIADTVTITTTPPVLLLNEKLLFLYRSPNLMAATKEDFVYVYTYILYIY
jgi:hypothetical protein